jgi:hypothetical protein
MKNIFKILVGKLDSRKLLRRQVGSVKIVLESRFLKMLGISGPGK